MRRFAPAGIAWAGVAALVALWLPTRGSLELNPVPLGAGLLFALRLDAIAFAAALAILVGGAALLTLRPGARWTALLAMAAAVVAVASADLVLTAAAAAVAVLFVLEAADGQESASWPLWPAVLLTAWAGVSLQVVGGTAGYGAAPAAALNAGIAGLVLLGAVGFVGAFAATESWPPVAWIAMPPIGLCLLLRVYTLGAGRLPQPALYVALAGVGVVAWGLASWRAASAESWQEFAGQSLPAAAGVGLLAAGSGVQLGAAAVVLTMFTSAVLAVVSLAASTRRRADALVAAAVLGGLPPGLGFVARLLAAQALLESDQGTAILLLPAALAWVLWVVAALRAVSLPLGGAATPRWALPVLGGVAAVAGAGAGLLVAGVAQPAVAAAGLGRAGPRLTAGLTGIEPASGGWPALLLGGLLIIAAAAAGFGGRSRLPAFAEPLAPLLPRWRPHIEWRVPALPRLAAVEAALTGARPLLWVVVLVGLALVVTRAPL